MRVTRHWRYRSLVSANTEREQMIEILAGLGVAREDVPESLGEAAGLASDVVLARDDIHSLNSLAAVVDLDPEFIRENFAHLGIQVDDPDAICFNEADIELARFLVSAVDTILTQDEGIEILHVAGTALNMVAEAAVASAVQGPERRAVNIVEVARLNAGIAELGLALSKQLSTTFRHHLRQAAMVNRRKGSRTNPDLVVLTIGFLDLVGFTSLSQSLSVSDLVELVKGFEAQAHELAHAHHARIVKLIGDEVMFVAESPETAAAFVMGMIDSFDQRDVVPRGGLTHGDLVNIHGDYFGPVVNLAARLVDSAVPGEVLVDDAVADVVDSEPAGKRMLKGFDAPVRVHSLLHRRQP